jgi:hypothetical protein
MSGSNAADQKAVSDSFSNHWMQIQQIISRSEVRKMKWLKNFDGTL